MEQQHPIEQQKTSREFSVHDVLFAWFSYITAYLLCRTLPVNENPLGGMLLIVVLFGFTAVFMKTKGIRLLGMPLAAMISGLAASVSLILSSNAFIHFFAYVYALGAYGYFLYAATGNSLKPGFSSLLLADWVKALFLMPFYSFGDFELFRGMFHGRNRKTLSALLKVAIGVGITIIPTGVVLVLLSYDKGFSDLVKRLFDFGEFNIFSHIFSSAFAVPIGMYLYGLYISSTDKKGNDIFTEEKCSTLSARVKIAPLSTALTAVIPLLVLYVLFFISQWQYYVSSFTGILPPNFSYAEYAREGFFQLCSVSVINLAVIVAVLLFMKKSKFSSPLLKVLTVIFSLCTLVLISTAVAKMVMYIRFYGLTQKRVYATWFMLVLAVVFILVLLGRFISKIKTVSLCAVVIVAAFSVLALANADSLIAKYNVDRYLNGTLETVDVGAMSDLKDASTPQLVRLAKHLDDQNGTDIATVTYVDVEFQTDLYSEVARALLKQKRAWQESDHSIFSFTLNGANAKAALKRAGLLE